MVILCCHNSVTLFFFRFYGYLLTKMVKFSDNHSFLVCFMLADAFGANVFVFWQTETISTRYYLYSYKLQAPAKLEIKFLLNSTTTWLLHFGVVQGFIVFKTSSQMEIILRITGGNKRNFTQIEQFLRKPDVRSHRCDSQWNTGCLSKLRLNLHCFVWCALCLGPHEKRGLTEGLVEAYIP